MTTTGAAAPAPPVACVICGGALELRYAGAAAGPDPSDFSPTCHRTGAHGDLYACRECATVQQPSLPPAGDLHDLYREMADDDYLAEEAGRRATANWLLDHVARRAPSGRLLEVGCGHGLLLDEARRRGYETVGIELSAASAAHARDRLGLDVRDVPLEDFVSARAERGRYDAVLLIDVLEHLDDPRTALEHCQALLAPGGVLVVVTPDPSTRVTLLRVSPLTGTGSAGTPCSASNPTRRAPSAPPTGSTATDGTPWATSARETLMPLPPASTCTAWATTSPSPCRPTTRWATRAPKSSSASTRTYARTRSPSSGS